MTKEIIGIDVSKLKLDIYCLSKKTYQVVENSDEGIERMFSQLAVEGVDCNNCLVAFEHTGMYSNLLKAYCSARDIAFTVIPAIKIKRSSGLVRGKDDHIDAKRIAEYVEKNKSTIVLSSLDSESVSRLKKLMSLRKSQVNMAAEIKGRLPQREVYEGLKNDDFIHQTEHSTLKFLEKKIAETTREINKVIKADEAIKKNFDLIKTITGVGDVIGTVVIATTNNFTSFTDARKFACHAGVAPFPNRSGSSIRGRTKTSSLADKSLKTLFHLGARSAMQYDHEMKTYYERKVAEGKNKMSVINAICFKLIQRIFAIIKRQTPYLRVL